MAIWRASQPGQGASPSRQALPPPLKSSVQRASAVPGSHHGTQQCPRAPPAARLLRTGALLAGPQGLHLQTRASRASYFRTALACVYRMFGSMAQTVQACPLAGPLPCAPSRSPTAFQARQPSAVGVHWVVRCRDRRFDQCPGWGGLGGGALRAASGLGDCRPTSLCMLWCSAPIMAAHLLQVAVPRAGGSCRARGHIVASAGAASAGGGGASARSAWVEKCLRRAQQTAILVDGVPFMPLAEVGHCVWGCFGRAQVTDLASGSDGVADLLWQGGRTTD